MFCVVAYDMPDTKRRTKLYKALKGFGVHTQFSVFECELDDRELSQMVAAIDKIIKPSEDAVKVYGFCRSCLDGIKVMGVGTVAREPDVVII
jgi:CRISPR-associated protein Cas2